MAIALETLTITASGTESGELAVDDRASKLIIETPATLTGTLALYGTLDGTTYKALHSAGSAVTLAANGIHTISPIQAKRVKLVSSSAEGAERSFVVKVD